MFEFVKKLQRIVEEFEGFAKRVRELETRVSELSTDVASVSRELEGVKALEERLEDEAVQKAHASAMVEFDLAIKQLREEIRNEISGIQHDKRVEELEKRVDKLAHRVAWLEYYVRILWEKEMAKQFKKSKNVNCKVKAKFNAKFQSN